MQARLGALNLERCQTALRALAAGWRANTLPAEFRDIRTKKEVYELTRHSTVSNSYYHIADGEPADTSPKAQVLRAFVAASLSPEQIKAREEEQRRLKLDEALNEFVGVKIEGYFPTPYEIATRMILLANYSDDEHVVLEPSAGTGELAEAIRATGAKVHCIEVDPRFCEVLRLRGFEHITCADFLQCREPYDCIIMNPPFEKLADTDHVRHAYELLKPDRGNLVSIMSVGAFANQNGKAAKFREWLKDKDYFTEDLPSGAFKESGTSVNAKILVIRKSSSWKAPRTLEEYLQNALQQPATPEPPARLKDLEL